MQFWINVASKAGRVPEVTFPGGGNCLRIVGNIPNNLDETSTRSHLAIRIEPYNCRVNFGF